jgi:hypothetical protein
VPLGLYLLVAGVGGLWALGVRRLQHRGTAD